MRIGLMVGATEGPDGTLDGLVATAKRYEAAGFDNLWMANIFGLDAITALAIVGRETQPHRARHGGGADLPAPPGRDRAAGAHHAGGRRGAASRSASGSRTRS